MTHLPHRDRDADVEGRSNWLTVLHAGEEAKAPQPHEERTVQVRIARGLNQFDARAPVGADSEARHRDQLDGPVPQRLEKLELLELGQKDRSSAHPTTAGQANNGRSWDTARGSRGCRR